MSDVNLGVPRHARPAWEELHRAITSTWETTPCHGKHRNWWTGGRGEQERAAAACLDCPVLMECATYAHVAGETSGVWGGRTAEQRKKGTP